MHVVAVGAALFLAAAVDPAMCPPGAVILEVQEGVQRWVSNDENVAPITTIASIRPASINELFSAEADAPIAAVAGLY